jgi:hypothetical protein
MSRSIVGVEVPDPGVDVFETSDSVRLSVFTMVGWVRGWKMGAVGLAGAEFQEPSKYKLIAS